MKKNLVRPLLLMTLPIFMVGAMAAWRQSQEVPPPVEEAPPPGASAGPLRLEFGEWKQVPPSPGEVATGHTIKLLGKVYLVGAEARAWRQQSFYRLNANDMAVQFRRGDSWHTVRRNGCWNGMRQTHINDDKFEGLTEQNLTFSLALPLNLVPNDATAVRLRGKMRTRAYKYGPGSHVAERQVVSAQLDRLLWKRGQPLPAPQVQRNPSLVSGPASVRQMGEAAGEKLMGYGVDRASAAVNIPLHSNFSPPVWDKAARPYEIVPQDLQIVDSTGKDWLQWQPPEYVREAVGEGNLGESKMVSAGVRTLDSKVQDYEIRVFTRQIPREAGQLKLKGRLSRRDRSTHLDDWPVDIEALVRPRWMTRNPEGLRLQSVRLLMEEVRQEVEQKNGKVKIIWRQRPCVDVALHYTAGRPLVVRGAVDPGGAMFASGQIELPSVIAQIPFGSREFGNFYGIFGSGMLHEAAGGQDELIVSWSQRVDDRQPPLIPQLDKAVGNNPSAQILRVPRLERHANGTRITVRYTLAGLKPHYKGLTFKAEIGLRNKGMLEIEQPLVFGQKNAVSKMHG